MYIQQWIWKINSPTIISFIPTHCFPQHPRPEGGREGVAMTPRVVSCTIFSDEMRCGGVVWCGVWLWNNTEISRWLSYLFCRDFLQVEVSSTPLIMAGSSDWAHPILYIVTLHCDTSHHLTISIYEPYNILGLRTHGPVPSSKTRHAI